LAEKVIFRLLGHFRVQQTVVKFMDSNSEELEDVTLAVTFCSVSKGDNQALVDF
jgi:hypothetical protein